MGKSGVLQSMGFKESDTITERLNKEQCASYIRDKKIKV